MESLKMPLKASQIKGNASSEELDIIGEIDVFAEKQTISLSLLTQLLSLPNNHIAVSYLEACARNAVESVYGDAVFLRGLIEISSYCKNNCNYCGIRRSNTLLSRYRMSPDLILKCCDEGYRYGMRTFVLQGGEDLWWTDERLCILLSEIKSKFPDCAITLSLGERSKESYEKLFNAGANRYLLRHETANGKHYSYLHPVEMSYENRMRCLKDLKEIGYQVGCGFMVGSPKQSCQTLWEDLQFIRSFRPHMVGIGPFVATKHTPFANEKNGSVEMTLRLLSIIRLLHPHVLLPATTALGTLHPLGREYGLMSGANVLMPNLSPVENRDKYHIYDNKISFGDSVGQYYSSIQSRIQSIGRRIVVDRGDFR